MRREEKEQALDYDTPWFASPTAEDMERYQSSAKAAVAALLSFRGEAGEVFRDKDFGTLLLKDGIVFQQDNIWPSRRDALARVEDGRFSIVPVEQVTCYTHRFFLEELKSVLSSYGIGWTEMDRFEEKI